MDRDELSYKVAISANVISRSGRSYKIPASNQLPTVITGENKSKISLQYSIYLSTRFICTRTC